MNALPSSRSPVATDAELWLRRMVILQGILPAPLLTLGVLAHLLLRGAGATVPASALVGVFMALTLIELVVILLWVRTRRRSRAWLLASRFMVCPACRYALTSSEPNGICPECGRQYDGRDLRQLWEAAYWTGLAPPRLPGEEAGSPASQ